MNKPNFAPGVHIECFNGSNQTITTIDLVRFFLKIYVEMGKCQEINNG